MNRPRVLLSRPRDKRGDRPETASLSSHPAPTTTCSPGARRGSCPSEARTEGATNKRPVRPSSAAAAAAEDFDRSEVVVDVLPGLEERSLPDGPVDDDLHASVAVQVGHGRNFEDDQVLE